MGHLARALTLAASALGLFLAGCGGGGKASHEIKIGIVATCVGPLAPFYATAVGGAELPLIQRGGRLTGSNPGAGTAGVVVGGKKVELFFGCGDDTAETALAEARRLVEQEDVDVLIGPVETAEGIAVRDYAMKQPEVAFVLPSSPAQATTLRHSAPNLFRFTTDEAQWTAGLGAYAFDVLHWRNAATMAPDESFGYGQVAGFVAEFCALGGNVVRRVWLPVGARNTASFAARIPARGIDGLFIVPDGLGAIAPAVRASDWLRSNPADRLVGGLGLAYDGAVLEAFGSRVAGVVTAGPVPSGVASPAWFRFQADFEKTFPGVPARVGSALPADILAVGYYDAMEAVLEALDTVGGDLSGGERAFMDALAKVELDAPNGRVTLDRNRQAIAANYLSQVQRVKPDQRARILGPGIGLVTLKAIADVDESFGGHFGRATPLLSRTNPPCTHGNPPPWTR
jgi:branched-chain amino acid transport system substrate-binding protein